MSELINEYLDLAALQKQTDTFIKNNIDAIKKAYGEIGGIKTSLNISSNTQQTIAGATSAARAMDGVTAAQKRLNDASIAYDKIIKDQNASTKQKNDANKTLLQTQKQFTEAVKSSEIAEREALKTSKQQGQAVQSVANEYQNLSKAYREAALTAKNYVVTLGANHPTTIQAIADAKKLHETLSSAEASVGQRQRNVGNYLRDFASGALAAAGITGGLTLVFEAVGKIFSLNKELESSVANLSSITGATGADLKALRDAAIDLSKQGAGSAKDYIEAMKLIGSAKPELLQARDQLIEVTKATKLLSEASGLSLPEAATRLTDALNQFGEPSQKATVYVDALAAAAKYGAAEVPQITEALLQFGAQAKSANINIYESAAAIELLAEKGLKGADAGVKLRNIFLSISAVNALPKRAIYELQQAGVNTDLLKDKSKSLQERLAELGKVQDNNTAIVKIFGKENFNAAQIVLQNLDRFKELTGQIKEQGVAAQQAATNTDTLAIKWEKFKNILASGFLGEDNKYLKNFVDGLTAAVTGVGTLFSEVGKGAAYLYSTLKNIGSALSEINPAGILQKINDIRANINLTNEQIKAEGELKNVRLEAASIVKDAAKKTIEEQQKIYNGERALLDFAIKRRDELKKAGQGNSEEAHKERLEIVRTQHTLEGLQKLIDDGKAAASKGGLLPDNEDHDSKIATRTKAHIKTIAEAIAELRQELAAIQLEQDTGVITFKEADLKSLDKYKSTIQEIFKLKASDKDKKAAAISLSVELNPISLRVINRQLHELAADPKDKIEIPVEVKFEPQSEEKAYQDALEGQLRFLAISKTQDELALLHKYNYGLIKKEEYEKELLKIQEKYAQDAIRIQIDSYKHELEFAFSGVKQTQEVADKKTEILKKIHELELELGRSLTKSEEDNLKKRKGSLLEFLSAAKEITANIGQAFNELYGIRYDQQKAKNEEAITDIEKKNKAEVEAINVSARTEEQKAAAIQLSNDKAQKQKEEIDRRNRKLEVDKARFEKASNIANIITSTALAVVNTLKQGGFFSIPLAIAIGALGAAQLARAIATPIPKYKYGKPQSDNYQGFAEVGHGKAELIEHKDGTMEVTPATPTLTYVNRDDVVHADAAAFMRNRAIKRTSGFAGMVSVKETTSLDTKNLERKLDKVENTIKNKPTVIFNVTERGMQSLANSGQNWTEYINKYVRGTA